MNYYAAFVAALTEDGQWAATTRAADRGESGRIGLAGGKIDDGETAEQAALREAAEEGWLIQPNSLSILHVQYVDGNPVVWFFSNQPAIPLEEWEEKGRITPIAVSYEALAASGYGNDAAMPRARAKLSPLQPYDV